MQSFNHTKNKRKKGEIAEQEASSYLEAKGYSILDRNSVHQHAELDLIAEDPKTHQIVFIEVKARSTTHFGSAALQISPSKIRFLYRAAELWLHKNRLGSRSCRFDVVAVEQIKGVWVCKHFENAFVLGL
jgi:putative endonuclease